MVVKKYDLKMKRKKEVSFGDNLQINFMVFIAASS